MKSTNVVDHVCKHLKPCRLRLGLTQDAIADMSDVSTWIISAIENKGYKPEPWLARKIFEALVRAADEYDQLAEKITFTG